MVDGWFRELAQIEAPHVLPVLGLDGGLAESNHTNANRLAGYSGEVVDATEASY